MKLKHIGLRNFHPRFYLTSKEYSCLEKPKRDNRSGHFKSQIGRLVFTTEPQGDGIWDRFWNWADTRQ